MILTNNNKILRLHFVLFLQLLWYIDTGYNKIN